MRHDLKFKDFKIAQFQEVESQQLLISGWAAIFGNIDSYGDVIQPGAFTKTLQERKDRIAFCYQHEIDEPIGKIQVLEEREKGLWVEVLISASEDDIQTKIKEGILKEMSIGYCTVNMTRGMIDGKDIYYLTEVKLYEISLVTIAANPLAVIESMKADERKGYFESTFERLISGERSHTKKYELLKLKSTIIALLEAEPVRTTQQQEPQKEIVTKQELLNALNL